MDEMAVIDVPKFIDVVLEKTGQDKLTYIGYSMGTTLSYILLSEKPEYNDKMKLVVSIAPVAYFTLPFKLPVYAVLAAAPVLRAFAALNQIDQILPQSKIIRVLGKEICTSELGKIFCGSFLTTIVSPEKFNFTALPEIPAYTPAGTSRNTVIHYYQMIKTRDFRKYDLGILSNKEKYGSATPPSYDLSKITSPQAIFYSQSDLYVSVKDANTLKKKLKNVVAFETAPDGYNHLDYMWATDAYEELYFSILKVIDSHR